MDGVDREHEWLKVPEVAAVLRIARSRAYELVAGARSPRSGSSAASG